MRKSLRNDVFGATPETTRQRRILPGTSGQNDHALHKRLDELPFQNWIGNFVGHAVVPVSEGSGLAAVARAEPRKGMADELLAGK